MVTVQQCLSPTFDQLRPVELRARPVAAEEVFPLYRDLTHYLGRPHQHPDETIAHVMAVCATYAYSDLDTLSEMVTRVGLQNAHCLSVTFDNDPMFVVSTAYLVQAGEVVILVYRGTEPVNLINWLTDSEAGPEKVELDVGEDGQTFGGVHPGFYRNVRATRYKIGEALLRAVDGRSIRDDVADGEVVDGLMPPAPMKALYVTGHSLGGAMAALMGALIHLQPSYRSAFDSALQAVYTFGQPMVGTPAFAAACEQREPVRDRLFRFIYEGDPVPSLPSRDTGEWQHFGREWHYLTELRNRPCGGWQYRSRSTTGQMRWIGSLLGAFGAFPLSQLLVAQNLPSLYRIDDHRPHHYVSTLTPRGMFSEFGDHEYVHTGLPVTRRALRMVEQLGRSVTQAHSARHAPLPAPDFCPGRADEPPTPPAEEPPAVVVA